ncbi:MAG: alpha/beta hydrolase [Leptospiraceae bacterium]|nr:alpha/beta hydrolase [Leptospiraceae bacterium]
MVQYHPEHPPATQSNLAERPSFLSHEIFPFQSKWMDVNGQRIHYIDEGKGTALVFFHGNPTYSFLFRKVIPLLRHRFRCIAFDYPGFGLSQATADYNFLPEEHAAISDAFLRKLKLKKWIPAVSDWGGPIGLRVAQLQQDRVPALIIGNTFAWPVNGDFHFEGFSRFFGGFLGKILIRHFHAFVRVLIPAGTRRVKLTESEMKAYLRPMATPDARMPTYIFPRSILKSKNFLTKVEEHLSALKNRRTLLLWGDRDIAFRAKEREQFQKALPNSRAKILSGAGHFIWEDSPEEIASEILKFSDSLG